MLNDYITVTAVLILVFSTMVVSTGGWEALRTQKGLETVLLIPLLWPVIISGALLVGVTIAIVVTFALVYGLMKVDRGSLVTREGNKNV